MWQEISFLQTNVSGSSKKLQMNDKMWSHESYLSSDIFLQH